MTNAMSVTERSVNDKSGSTNHLKDIFDQSVAVLCEGDSGARARRRSLPLHIDAVSLQKRALSDAAGALAALWKISENRSPKLHRGAVQYSR
jgi:hypothetical protein